MNGTAKKILFVEDEPIAQMVYGKRLEREGFEISFAEDGEIALNRLSQGRPDLVVLDLMLPKVKGAEVLKHIRSEERLKETPVLILSNAYVTELSQQAMESGATRGMLKTDCTPAKLVEAVRDMLGFASAFDLSDKPVTEDSQAEAFMAAAEEAHADEMTLKETRVEFLEKAPAEIAKIREFCLAYMKAGTKPASLEQLNNLYQEVRFFATRAGLSGCVRIALLASAFEALLFDVVFKPERATASTTQTFAQAVDCLERLSQGSSPGIGEPNLKAKILVVDDDTVSNAAMMAVLKRAHYEPVSVADPAKAVEIAQATYYDIVLLDINMKGINGFEVCEKLRSMPEYKETPIIFVTSNGDFQSRARGILSGGNDLILKPVSPVELVLKTTMRLLQPHGLWAETSAVASVLKTTMRLLQSQEMDGETIAVATERNLGTINGSAHNGSARNTSIPLTPSEPAVPGIPIVPDAPKEELSISTEIIRRAWASSGDAPSKPAQPEKTPGADAGNEINQLKMAGNNEEPPKVVAPEKPLSAGDKKEESKLKIVEANDESPKLAEPEKPLPVIESNAEEKPQITEVEAEAPQPEAEVKAAPIDELPPAEPIPLPNVVPMKSNSEPNHSTTTMETKNKSGFDEAARGIARIIFGDENISDMNVRLTRIALERYNVPGTQNLNDIAKGVAQIIFGDDKISDMNVRLTRIALERYNITEVLGSNGSSKPAENGAPLAVSSF